MRILVVEDNRDILTNVLDYLSLKGYSVDCAEDGLSGMHLAVTGHYDLASAGEALTAARTDPTAVKVIVRPGG